MSDGPSVAVVIVAFESRDTLATLLAGLEASAGPATRTVVVDNASSDGSVESVTRRFPNVVMIANAVNLGFAAACNQGTCATRTPLVLFLNPDATLAPGALATLLAHFDRDPRLGILGPLTRSSNGDVQVSTGPDLTLRSEWRQRRLVRGVGRRDPRALAEAAARHAVEHEPGWVSGACLLARREALDAVSGFDERFFLYEEDADLCRRVRAAGWRVLFTPAAEARHARGLSMARAPERARLEYHRSHLLYYRKHCGLFQGAALRLLLAGRAVFELAKGGACADRARCREAVAWLRLATGGRSAG